MTEISEALGLLQEAIDGEIASANSQGAKAFELGKHDQVERQVRTSKELAAFKKKVDALEGEYRKIGASRKKSPRAPKGTRTPQKEYYEPIMTALKEMGGRGQSREIVDRVGEIMGAQLENEVDQGKLKYGDIRWRNACSWAFWKLRKEGKLKKDSPRGIWELAAHP